jgi:hypothetical protein
VRTRRRQFSVAMAVVSLSTAGALGSGLVLGPRTQAADPNDQINWTWTRTEAKIVANYVVHPTADSDRDTSAGPGTSPTADANDHQRDLSPKSFPAVPHAAKSNRAATAAPSSDNTVSPADSSHGSSVPPLSATAIGMQGSNKICVVFPHGCNPPDMAIAASPTDVLQGVNTSFEVLDTAGNVRPGWPVTAAKFFNAPLATKADGSLCDAGDGSQPLMSDPRAAYDAGTGRFWAAMLQYENAFNNALDCQSKSVYYIAVSQTGDPSGAWNVYEFEMSGGRPFTADYTQVGFNGDAVFFSANMFRSDNGPGFYAEIFEANKAQMMNGQNDFHALGFRDIQATSPGTAIANVGPFLADTLQPVQTVDSNGGRSSKRGGTDGLFLDTVDGPDLQNGNLCSSAADACKGLLLWRMSNPIGHDSGGSRPSLSVSYLPDTKPFYFGPAADQPSCTQCIDSNDLRISGMPQMRNGTIYAAMDTGINNGTQVVPGLEWLQVGTSNNDSPAVKTGYFNFSGDTAATYGTMMPMPNGSVAMIYERMSSSLFPETRITVRDQGSSNFTSPGRLLKAGEANYRPTLCGTTVIPVCRWGDYEAMSFDGQGHIWFAGEYSNTHTNPGTAPQFGRNWGTWIGAIPA